VALLGYAEIVCAWRPDGNKKYSLGKFFCSGW
jgi:hypothetical protein